MDKLGEFFFLISTIIYLPLHNVINKSDCTNLIDNMKIKDLYSGGMEKDNHYKGSVHVISSDILLRDRHARVTKAPVKFFTKQNWENILVFLSKD